MAKIRKMVGDVLAARVVDEGGSWLFELKTDGRVMWMQPHRMDEAIDKFFESFNVEEELQDELREAFRSGKLTTDQVDLALHGTK